jgi:hypothetical protein
VEGAEICPSFLLKFRRCKNERNILARLFNLLYSFLHSSYNIKDPGVKRGCIVVTKEKKRMGAGTYPHILF